MCREHEVPVLARGCGTGLAGPLCCGRPLYDYGMLPTARRWLRCYPAKIKKDQVTKLTTALREGTPEPLPHRSADGQRPPLQGNDRTNS